MEEEEEEGELDLRGVTIITHITTWKQLPLVEQSNSHKGNIIDTATPIP